MPLTLLAGETAPTPEALHIVLHETAYLGWRIARPLSADDRLNEGLAEYAANRLARDLLPDEFSRDRVRRSGGGSSAKVVVGERKLAGSLDEPADEV